MPKRPACPVCGAHEGEKRAGTHHCAACGAIWWTVFDRPRAGHHGKGRTCYQCGRLTMHLVAELAGHGIWRCSRCAAVLIHKEG